MELMSESGVEGIIELVGYMNLGVRYLQYLIFNLVNVGEDDGANDIIGSRTLSGGVKSASNLFEMVSKGKT